MSLTSLDFISGSSYTPFFFLTNSSTGEIVTTGTVLMVVYEQQDDGTLKMLDTTSDTFKTTGHSTTTTTMSHQNVTGISGPGLWSGTVNTTNFIDGKTYYFYIIGIAGVVPQMRQKQYFTTGPAAGMVRLANDSHGGGVATLELQNVSINNTSNAENPGGTGADAVYIQAGTGMGVRVVSSSGNAASLATGDANALAMSNNSTNYSTVYTAQSGSGGVVSLESDSNSNPAMFISNSDDNGVAVQLAGTVIGGNEFTLAGVPIASTLTTIKTDTTTEIPASISGLNNISAAEVNEQVDAAIVTYGLDHLVFTSVSGSDVADDSIMAMLVDDSSPADWGNFNSPVESLGALSTRTTNIHGDTGNTIPTAISALETKVDVIDGIVDDIIEDTGTTLPEAIVTYSTPPDVDGVSYDDMMTAMMAVTLGVATVSGNDVLFKARDGTTTKVTITYTATDGQRTVSTIA